MDSNQINILVIPDKFKGTLTAADAADAIARGWRSARPGDTIDVLPLTDGGDGFGEVLSSLLQAKAKGVKTIDAAGRPCNAVWWWQEKSRTALIESARVIGLAMLPPNQFHPFHLDTFGLGAVVRAAAEEGTKHCLLGIGGSATNDGGFGLARALGWKFFDSDGQPIEQWTALATLDRLCPPRRRRWFRSLAVAVDVENPLLGPQGATRVYGPQKGLKDFAAAERCLRRLALVVKHQLGRDLARVPGAGAAGGLGFGLMAFLDAHLERGFDLFARHLDLRRHLRRADLVLTGEGQIDASTFMGKGVGRLAQHCRLLKIPCLAFAGTVVAQLGPRRPFREICALTDLTTLEEARARPGCWLAQLAARTAGRWPSRPSACARSL